MLGVGSTSSYSRGTVTFSPRPGVKIVFARTRVAVSQQPVSLWTTTTAYLISRDIDITSEAVYELSTFIQDADDVLESEHADIAAYQDARTLAKRLVDDAIVYATSEGRSIVVREDIARAKTRLCPIFPFCKKQR